MYLFILIGALFVIFLVGFIWLAYTLSAAYQQTLTFNFYFDETYRYVPHLNPNIKYKLDKIKITVSGSVKKDTISNSTITLANKVNKFINESIINPYKNCLIIQEAKTFTVNENVLRRCPINNDPTVENLSVMFFNKLSALLPEIGAELVSVSIYSDNIKATNSRYKISNYTI